MSRSNLAYAAVALLVGLLLGFAFTAVAFRRHWIPVPGQGLVERMDRVLKLTPAQRAQIETILADARQRAYRMHADYRRQRHQMVTQTREQVRALLTADQQRAFDRYFPLPRARVGQRNGEFGGGYRSPGP